ncbi:MAG: RtcB family protein [Pirellulaceae bacterium]|nr:RtcB family protein [Pirellulaceae bacterium]
MDTIELKNVAPSLSEIVVEDKSPITVIANESIRETFDQNCLQQAVNSRRAPGVSDVVLNPDAHIGYGAPVGCVMTSPTHIYPGPVGVDIKCSMSLLQLNLPEDAIKSKTTRRELIKAICERTPTGVGRGRNSVRKSRRYTREAGREAAVEGVSENVCEKLRIPPHWAERCEDAFHLGHTGEPGALRGRLEYLSSSGLDAFANIENKLNQLGSYGGGNHFGECEVVKVSKDKTMKKLAKSFGLKDGRVAFLSHCGSRGLGNRLATNQFRLLEEEFDRKGRPFPAGDRHLVYAELGTEEANNYLDDMALGANFATVNHMLINALVLEAFQEIFPGTEGELVYFISHNIARKEIHNGQETWVHRKGATRAFPAGHVGLEGTPFAETGHPILLPGNPCSGSAVMVATEGAKKSCYSVNHGAGRVLSRRKAKRTLDQQRVNSEMEKADILSNARRYPLDEAPAVYKDFEQVLKSVKEADLAQEVARLKAKFVIKDSSHADD